MLSQFRDYKKILAFIVYIVFALLFWPFKVPLLFAVLFAFALNPILKRIKARFPKINRDKTLVAGTLILILAVFCAPIFILIFSSLAQIKKIESGSLEQLPIYQKIETVLQTANTWVQSISDQAGVDISSYIDLNVIFSKISQMVLPVLTSLVTQLPVVIFNFIIFIVSLYLILTKTEFFHKWFAQLNLFTQDQVDQLSALIQRICHLVLVSAVLVAAVQAFVVSIACLIAGYTDFMMIFMITFFMSFLPVIGSAPMSIALIIYSFLNANISGGLVLIIAAIIAGSIDNVIRTYMLTSAEKAGAHPFVSLLALIGSLSLFGFLGLFLGPIVCELAYQIGGILILNEKPKESFEEDMQGLA